MTGTASSATTPERRIGLVTHPAFAFADGEDPVLAALLDAPFAPSLVRIAPRAATFEELTLVHDIGFVHAVARASAGTDAFVRIPPGSAQTAALATGAGLAAMDRLFAVDDPLSAVFCAVRPPGHHAGVNEARGLCVFNHSAVAARYAQRVHGAVRVAILDWDAHHGDGTQAIFAADPTVLYLSLHQWPHYPGTGWHTEVGAGAGQGFSVNLPLLPGAGDATYRMGFARIVEPVVDRFAPDLIVVSAGQDAAAADPLSDLSLSDAGFAHLAARVRALADRCCGGRLLLIQESGYNRSTPVSAAVAAVEPFADAPEPVDDAPSPPPDRFADLHERRLDDIAASLRPFWAVR